MTDDTRGRDEVPAGGGLRAGAGSHASFSAGSHAGPGSHRYFENVGCEYYPCHAIPRVNCLFCFCPLYHLPDCGGEWTLTDKGVKDCSRCVRPHVEGGYEFVMKRLS